MYRFVLIKNVGTMSKEAPYNVRTLQDTQGGVYIPSLSLNYTVPRWSNITRGNSWQGYCAGPRDTKSGVVVFAIPQDVPQFKSLTSDDGGDTSRHSLLMSISSESI